MKSITTRKQAITEVERMKLPMPSPEEMAPVAAAFGLMELQGWHKGDLPQNDDQTRALQALQTGDVQAYLSYIEARDINSEAIDRLDFMRSREFPWGINKFVALCSTSYPEFMFISMFYEAILYEWLSQYATRYEGTAADYARSQGLETNFREKSSDQNFEEVIRHNFAEVERLSRVLLAEHNFYAPPFAPNWILPPETPEWVRFTIGQTPQEPGQVRARGGKRAAPSQMAERRMLGLATSFPFSYSITAMNQRAAWVGAEQGAFKVERGYSVSLKNEKVHIVYFLGELEFEDDLHPQPFGAAQTTEILKRWGLLHSFLHAGLCVALSESNGRGVELGEKDLLFISGLKASVEKGHVKKAVALERIRAALKDLGTLSAAVRSTDRRVETDRQPLFIAQPILITEDGQARSIAAHIAPGHWLKKYFGFDRPNFDIPKELFTLPAGLPSWLGIWLTANVWRFDKGRRVTLRRVLEGAIPQVKPENPEEWEGHSITWAELEPAERNPQSMTRMKKCREALREQLSRAERELAAHNIIFKIQGGKRTGTTWEDFLDSPTSLRIVGVEARQPLLERVLESAHSESNLTGEAVKTALKAAGMKQTELAQVLGVTAAVITRWLKPPEDPAHRPIPAKHEASIRELLKID